MKKCFKKILLGASILPMLLTSCGSIEKSIALPYDLDYLAYLDDVNANEDKFFPEIITTDELIMLAETKQTFALYAYSDNCSVCKELATPKVKRFLRDNKLPYKIYAYDVASIDFSMLEKYEQFNEIVNVGVPQIIFYNVGKPVTILSDRRYTSYKLFSSAMTSFYKPTNMYMSSTQLGIETFLLKNNDYLLYVNGKVFTDSINKLTSKYPSYNYFSEYVYPVMSKSKTPTLIINSYDLEPTYKIELFQQLGFDINRSTWAMTKNGNDIKRFDYHDTISSTTFIEELKKY